MVQWTGWLGAGVLTAGVTAAALAGAGTAGADRDGASDSGPAKTSSAANAKPSKATSSGRHHDKSRLKRVDRTSRLAAQPKSATEATSPHRLAADRDSVRDELREKLAPATAVSQRTTPATAAKAVTVEKAATAEKTVTTEQTTPASEATAADATSDVPPVIKAVGSAVFDAIGGLIRTLDGPPVVPPALRDAVEVSSSTLVVSPGNEVPADWYFPTHGNADRLIYLQHGFIATGPMYSYTASYLAERTNSVVVVTTVTSNPFAEGGMWLGGDPMHQAVAQLFLDPDRKALNTSMSTASLKAGHEIATVPQQFVLVGHSLGGGFAPGVAGHYAEGLVARRADGHDAANDLAGVILLDGVPPSGTLPSAMDRLEQLEDSNGHDPADYVPVYEIGAPWNLFNSVSTVNDDLSAARPGKFNGVVVDGGVHMDSMLGGNPLIQGAAYLIAGIPQPQNPPAVQWLMAGWVNDMFDDNIDPVTGRCLTDCHGVYGDPGETLDIDADRGAATAVVIDSGAAPDESDRDGVRFSPIEAAFIPRSVLSRLA